MKIAIATTTINQPVLLELLRQYGSEVEFFVALDKKSVPPTILALDQRTHFITPDEQSEWKCSELISWGCIQRRNIATLAAIRWGAEIVIHWDDDNLPMNANYFKDFREVLYWPEDNTWRNEQRPFNGLKVSGFNGWFDSGQLLIPPAKHRGFPFRQPTLWKVGHVTGAKVGVAAGMCLGDPDVDAVTRLNGHLDVHGVSQLLESGIVVDPSTKTVFNSQNTAFIRELAPAMFMMPGIGRYDDIYASLICQRVMRPRNLHVHFGKPFVWQQRNPHDLMKDLRAEMEGMENVEKLARYLDGGIALDENDSIITQLRAIYNGFGQLPHSYDILPEKSIAAALAFLDDIEQLL